MIRRIFANIVFYSLIGACCLLAVCVAWAADNMDFEPVE